MKELLDIYRLIYAEIGEDFDKIDKSESDWFENYYLPQERQDEIARDYFKGKRFSKLRQKQIFQSLWLGSTPKG